MAGTKDVLLAVVCPFMTGTAVSRFREPSFAEKVLRTIPPWVHEVSFQTSRAFHGASVPAGAPAVAIVDPACVTRLTLTFSSTPVMRPDTVVGLLIASLVVGDV